MRPRFPNVRAVLVLAAATVTSHAMSGCGSVNTTSSREGPSPSASPVQTRVNDLLSEIFLSAKEAKDYGLIDEVIPRRDKSAPAKDK